MKTNRFSLLIVVLMIVTGCTTATSPCTVNPTTQIWFNCDDFITEEAGEEAQVSLRSHAQWILGTADADWSGSDSVISVDAATIILPTSTSTWPGSEPTELENNRHCIAGKDDDIVLAYWDDVAEKFHALCGKLREEEIMTDFRVDTDNLKLQKKTRKIWAHITAAESDWVDIHTGDACK